MEEVRLTIILDTVLKRYSFLELGYERNKDIFLTAKSESVKLDNFGFIDLDKFEKIIYELYDNEVKIEFNDSPLSLIEKYFTFNKEVDNDKAILELSYFLSLIKSDLNLDEALILVSKNDALADALETVKSLPSIGVLSTLMDAYNMINKSNESISELSEDLDIKDLLDLDDDVKMYFTEISRYRLLTYEEEVSLGLKKDLGDVKAYQELVNHNLRLVIPIAKRYLNRGLSFLDLIQEGNLGLMEAASRYNYKLGYKFSTYATWWIRRAIQEGVYSNVGTYKIPAHAIEECTKIYKFERDFIQVNGREPDLYEISDGTGFKYRRVFDLVSALRGTISLSTPVSSDNPDSELGEFIEDKSFTMDESFDETYNSELLDTIFNKCGLTEREATVIKLRFGVDSGEVMTLENVAKIFGITRERIRQIEAKALTKIKRNKKINAYKKEDEIKILTYPVKKTLTRSAAQIYDNKKR